MPARPIAAGQTQLGGADHGARAARARAGGLSRARGARRFRVPTQYDKEAGVLTITHIPEQDACQYAYFASYSYQRHQSMVADLQARDGVRLEMMGQTLHGHDLVGHNVGPPPPPPPPHPRRAPCGTQCTRVGF